jgi:hypothetical protein
MSVKRHLTLVAMLALAGCSTTRHATVYCVTPEQITKLEQAKPEKVGDKLTGRADHDIKPIAGRLIRVEAWGDGLMGVLRGCTG